MPAIICLYMPVLLIVYALLQPIELDNQIAIFMAVVSLILLVQAYISNHAAFRLIWEARPLTQLILYIGFVAVATLASGTIGTKEPIAKLTELAMLAVYISPGLMAFAYLAHHPERLGAFVSGVDLLGRLVLGTLILGFFYDVRNETAAIQRVFGVYGDSVAWGMSFYVIYYLTTRKWLLLAGFVVMLGLSGSMGATVASAVGIAFYMLLLALRGRFNLIYPAIGIVVVAVVASTIDLSSVPVLQRFISDDQRAFSLNARFGSWLIAFEMGADHPVFGVGFSGFGQAALGYDPERYFDLAFSYNYISNAQNQIMQALAETGVPGLILFFSAMLTTIFVLLRLEKIEARPSLHALWGTAASWFAAMLLTNHTAVWILPHNILVPLASLLIGMAAARRQHWLLEMRAMRGPQ